MRGLILKLALQSALSRKATLVWIVFSVMLSTILLTGIDQIRRSAENTFAESVSGTDLIVAARNSPLAITLYSVFRLGEPTQLMPYETFEQIKAMPGVQWAVPVSLGDSYGRFSVMGTSADYFQHFKYSEQKPLVFAQGRPFGEYQKGDYYQVIFEAVIGHEVAKKRGLKLGDSLALNHGSHLDGHDHDHGHGHDDHHDGGHDAHADHGDKPFKVVGILEATGTPVDRSVHVSLQALEAIHLNWRSGKPIEGFELKPELTTKFDLTPRNVNAMLLALDNRAAVFQMKNKLENGLEFPVTAVMPGVALTELWRLLDQFEKLLLSVSVLVGVVSLLGLISVLLLAMKQRDHEMRLLRAAGARRLHLMSMLCTEALWVMLAGALLGLLSLWLIGQFASPWLLSQFGIALAPIAQAQTGLLWVLAYVLAGTLAGLIPGLTAYRQNVV